MKNKQINLRCTARQKKALENCSREEGLSITDYIFNSIKTSTSKKESEEMSQKYCQLACELQEIINCLKESEICLKESEIQATQERLNALWKNITA